MPNSSPHAPADPFDTSRPPVVSIREDRNRIGGIYLDAREVVPGFFQGGFLPIEIVPAPFKPVELYFNGQYRAFSNQAFYFRAFRIIVARDCARAFSLPGALLVSIISSRAGAGEFPVFPKKRFPERPLFHNTRLPNERCSRLFHSTRQCRRMRPGRFGFQAAISSWSFEESFAYSRDRKPANQRPFFFVLSPISVQGGFLHWSGKPVFPIRISPGRRSAAWKPKALQPREAIRGFG